jgi:hypothetical protein
MFKGTRSSTKRHKALTHDPQRNPERNAFKSTNRVTNENPPKIPPKIAEKEKHREQRICHFIEKEAFIMNILAKFGYNPLSRITNLGWQKAQTKSHSPLTPSLPKSTPK